MSRSADLAEFGRRIAAAQGEDGERDDVNWTAYGRAAEAAMGRRRQLPDLERYSTTSIPTHPERSSRRRGPLPPAPPSPPPAYDDRDEGMFDTFFGTVPPVRPRLRWHHAFGGHSLGARGFRAHTRRHREGGWAAWIDDPSGRRVWSGQFDDERGARRGVEAAFRERHYGEYRRRSSVWRERSRALRRAGMR